MPSRTAFGGMLQEIASLGILEFRTELLDRKIERRLKHLWEQRTCPDCGVGQIYAGQSSDRIWCGRCSFMSTYTLGTPFYDAELAGGEFLVAFVLYADSLLSINQIAMLLDRAYDTIHSAIRKCDRAFQRGFPAVWERLDREIDGPTQIDESQQVCSGFKSQDPPRDSLSRGGSPEGGRTRWTGDQGDELTLVAACRDVLRVISAEKGTRYDEELAPVLEEAQDLSQELGEVWTDEYPPYQQMNHDHRTVLHDEEYVSSDGVHTNQVECLWSIIQPWLRKFRGLSRQGLEQAARTFGFLRSLTLARAPL
ncbi:IS1595 family transposase [Haloglomus irregulare]|uniref:IS1595 family transposase n=1 Tax=Haloglomus irregulare TaxID=2234134 RepID=A0A554MWK4_9EURY|nr:IS1595 family transposase [Haloglomus irregulare]TSD09190.1 IS1595 family transposase [Haloglomus irregulare]